MSKLLLSCKKATELIEKRTYYILKPKERLQLFLHKQLCEACRNYEKQSLVLHKLIIKNFEKDYTNKLKNEKLKEELKNKIDEL